jgi:hypothetical protein
MSWLHGLSRKQLGQLLAILIALGYVDINVVTFRAGFFAFVVKGPLFTRLTSGSPRYLRSPGDSSLDSPVAKAFIKIEALLAFLLLTGQAYVQNPTVVGSGLVFTIQSDWFTLQTVQHMLKNQEKPFIYTAVLTLLNLGVGVGLVQNTFGITGTAYGPFPYQLGFSTTSDLLSTTNNGPVLPGLAAIPEGGPMYKWFNRVIGLLLIGQQLELYSVSVSKGGRLVLGITGQLLKLRVLPKMLDKWRQSHGS